MRICYFYYRRHSAIDGSSTTANTNQSMPRSKSNDLLRSNGTIDSLRSSARFGNFKALKQWGKHRLRLSITKSNEARIDEVAENEPSPLNGNNCSSDSVKSVKSKPKTQAEKMLKQNPLYSSSEKLFPASIVEPVEVKRCAATTNPVKLRTSMTRRQRRNKQYRCEEPNSSSGNWSASSESGRTSASSEIAMHNKSSTSCSSLHSKPPVTQCPSALTKRRINTSTSSSITSDETLTHDIPSSGYVEYDDETSSMYSCDTEGYFTSFHVDSGLKTLKEEETLSAVPALISTSALINESNVSSSMGDSINSMSRTNNSVSDSDYELFGKGSTSTTASSAGTVCTTLLGSLSNNSLVETPQAPERKSSLNSKLSNISNYAKPKVLLNKHNDSILNSLGKDKEASLIRRSPYSVTANMDSIGSNGLPLATISDLEISETSDFEGIEHVKRMQGKTKINSNRIPSICVITPSHSDDEDRVAAMESMLSSLNINQNEMLMNELADATTTAQVHAVRADENDNNLSDLIKWTPKRTEKFHADRSIDQTDGEYVTITDVASYPNTYRFDDNVDNNLERILSGNLNKKTEYVSLNDLPGNMNINRKQRIGNGKDTKLVDGTNVKRNAHGMFVYETNTLRYKRSLCTTFKGISSDDVSKPSNIQAKNVEQNRNTVADKGASQNGSPPFDQMVSDGSLQGLEDVYVTLAVDRKSTTNNARKTVTSSPVEGKQ